MLISKEELSIKAIKYEKRSQDPQGLPILESRAAKDLMPSANYVE